MARTNNALKNTGLIVAVIAVAFGIGYYALGGSRTAPTPTDTLAVPAAAPAPVAVPRVVSNADPHVAPRTHNSDYTAPGAPRIRIVEAKSGALTLTRRPAQPEATADTSASASTDSEASQAAAPGNVSSGTDTSATGIGNASPNTNPSAASGGSTPLIPPAAPPTPAAGSASDQDFEQPGGHAAPEAGQDGISGSGKAQFRVQTGSFAAQQNARVLADALRSRGYVTSTRSEQEDGRTVYKVQVGAYRSRAAADKAAQDLQKSGYPAYSSPIAP